MNPLYLIVHEVDGFIEEKEGSKYLNFPFTDSNSEVLKKYAEIWGRIKDQIKAINRGQSGEYGKDYMTYFGKIKDGFILLILMVSFSGILDIG